MRTAFRVGGIFNSYRSARIGAVSALGFGVAVSLHSYKQRKFPSLTSSCEGSVGDLTGAKHHSGQWTKRIEGMPFGIYTYEGGTLDGEMHGQGKLTAPKGAVFNGTFEHGEIVSGKMKLDTEGLDSKLFPNFVYEGRFENWRPHGVGKLYLGKFCIDCTFNHGVVDRNSWTIRPPSGKLTMEVNCYFPWLYYTYTITCPGEYKLTGTFSAKPFRGTKTYLLGDVESESGPFLEYFSFLGHRLVLHGEGTRYYRDGTVESGRFILGVLHTDKFDSEVRIAARLLEKALMRIVLWDWD